MNLVMTGTSTKSTSAKIASTSIRCVRVMAVRGLIEFCMKHHDDPDREDDRKLLEKAWKIGSVPPDATYKYTEGCLQSDSPECRIQVARRKVAESPYIKNCSSQYVNARVQILVASHQQASEDEARLAADCRWIYRCDVILASRSEHYPVRTMRSMNSGKTRVVSLASPKVLEWTLTVSGPASRLSAQSGINRSRN